MKLLVTRRSLRWILRWTARGFFAFAFATLVYSAFVVFDAWTFQRRARSELTSTPGGRKPSRIGPDGLIGSIEVPRLGLSAAIFEGTSTTTLRRAVGHISATALPGESGNVALAGHRDTFFRPLENIRRDDIINVTVAGGVYPYRVVSTRVVAPTDVSVLSAAAIETLTLVTCYPFSFVGPAPDRFIVRAEAMKGDRTTKCARPVVATIEPTARY